MRAFMRIMLALVVMAGGVVAAVPAQAAMPAARPVPGTCVEGTLPGGALSLICVPASGWNGDLVVFAHGYVGFNEPLYFANLEFDGVYMPDLAQRLGFAFATTSYRRNGLAILEGVEDVRELVAKFVQEVGQPRRSYIIGASEGGIVTALSAERSADIFTAGLSMCGPVGDFQRQINYWGDFRLLFDYFFPGALPPSPLEIPDEVIANWDSQYAPAIEALVDANPDAAAQLISTSRAPIDANDPGTTVNTTMGLLWYNVFATNDGKAQLGGNPYDNLRRFYFGSDDNRALNRAVPRVGADEAATAALQPYNTTGQAGIPLVTLHTTGDEIIPFWHQRLYRQKLQANGVTNVVQIPIRRYGHCDFTIPEVLVGVAVMVGRATGEALTYVPPEYDLAPVRAQMEQAAAEYAAQPLDE